MAALLTGVCLGAPLGAVGANESQARIVYPGDPARLDPFSKRVFDSTYLGDLAELQRAYAEAPLEFSKPGVGALLLNLACKEGRAEVAEWLLRLGCDANEPHLGNSPLSAAIGWDSATWEEKWSVNAALTEKVRAVIMSGRTSMTGIELRAVLEKGDTARTTAAFFRPLAPEVLARKARTVTLLLALGADPRAAASAASVCSAVLSGHDGEMVRRLVAAGADPRATLLENQVNALHIAAQQGNLSAAEALLECGLRIDGLYFPFPADFPGLKIEPSGGGLTALTGAILQRQEAMVRLLLDRGADPNQSNRHLCTALHFAASQDHPGILARLLAAGARPDAADINSITPLQIAAFRGHLENAKLLCAAGATLELSDTAGYTPLLWAAEKDQPEILGLLLARGADRHALTDDGKSALRVAAAANALRTIELLLANGESANGGPRDPCTPLHEASSSGFGDAVRLLLQRGANPDSVARAAFGGTPLLWAVSSLPLRAQFGAQAAAKSALFAVGRREEVHYVEVVRLLLDAHADIDAKNPRSDTSLHIAAENGLAQIATLLLERGARSDLADSRRMTARELAVRKGHAAIVALIDQAEQARGR